MNWDIAEKFDERRIVVRYDDSENFPWVLWCGNIKWDQYRDRNDALKMRQRLIEVVKELWP
jgi:hypothetical protein